MQRVVVRSTAGCRHQLRQLPQRHLDERLDHVCGHTVRPGPERRLVGSLDQAVDQRGVAPANRREQLAVGLSTVASSAASSRLALRASSCGKPATPVRIRISSTSRSRTAPRLSASHASSSRARRPSPRRAEGRTSASPSAGAASRRGPGGRLRGRCRSGPRAMSDQSLDGGRRCSPNDPATVASRRARRPPPGGCNAGVRVRGRPSVSGPRAGAPLAESRDHGLEQRVVGRPRSRPRAHGNARRSSDGQGRRRRRRRRRRRPLRHPCTGSLTANGPSPDLRTQRRRAEEGADEIDRFGRGAGRGRLRTRAQRGRETSRRRSAAA